MSQNKLTTDEHFQLVYKSKILLTDEQVHTYDPISVGYSPNPYNVHVQQKTENVVNIKMPESEYKRFIKGYENYLDLIHAMSDPISKDMFEKLMMYIKLKK